MTYTDIEYRHIGFDDLEKRLDEATGSFAGYACRWGVVDSYQTLFTRSAFGNATRSQTLPLLFMHDPDRPVGVFSWREDEEGLYIEGRFDSTPEGQSARIRATSSAPGLSVGFIRRGDDEDGARITSAELREVSQITLGFASQPGAELVAVRKAAEIMQRMDEGETVEEAASTPDSPEVPEVDPLKKEMQDIEEADLDYEQWVEDKLAKPDEHVLTDETPATGEEPEQPDELEDDNDAAEPEDADQRLSDLQARLIQSRLASKKIA